MEPVEVTRNRTTAQPASAQPDEPEQLTLWRQVIDRRDRLLRDIEAWDVPEHPARKDLTRIAEVHGSHGCSALRLDLIDTEAKRHAERCRAQLVELDIAVRAGTRNDASGEKGATLRQLQALAHPDDERRRKRAREHLVTWWDDRDDRNKARAAALAIYRYQHATEATPIDFAGMLQPEALDVADLEWRRKSPEATRRRDAVITRILDRIAPGTE